MQVYNYYYRSCMNYTGALALSFLWALYSTMLNQLRLDVTAIILCRW